MLGRLRTALATCFVIGAAVPVLLALTAAPAGAVEVTSEAELDAAFADGSVTEIVLTDSITLTCAGGQLERNESTNPLVVSREPVHHHHADLPRGAHRPPGRLRADRVRTPHADRRPGVRRRWRDQVGRRRGAHRRARRGERRDRLERRRGAERGHDHRDQLGAARQPGDRRRQRWRARRRRGCVGHVLDARGERRRRHRRRHPQLRARHPSTPRSSRATRPRATPAVAGGSTPAGRPRRARQLDDHEQLRGHEHRGRDQCQRRSTSCTPTSSATLRPPAPTSSGSTTCSRSGRWSRNRWAVRTASAADGTTTSFGLQLVGRRLVRRHRVHRSTGRGRSRARRDHQRPAGHPSCIDYGCTSGGRAPARRGVRCSTPSRPRSARPTVRPASPTTTFNTLPRHTPQGGSCDIGAIEMPADAPPAQPPPTPSGRDAAALHRLIPRRVRAMITA